MDLRLREAEQAWQADPRDRASARRYARLLVRLGRREEACGVLGVVWRASPRRVRTTSYEAPHLPRLTWGGRALGVEDVERLVAQDLERFDPVLLMEHFPRCADGRVRLKTTCFLRRYDASGVGYAGSRLVLLATTGDSLSPAERRRRAVAVELQVRRLNVRFASWLLPPEQWRS